MRAPCSSGSARAADDLPLFTAHNPAELPGRDLLAVLDKSAIDVAPVLNALRRYRGLDMAITSENLSRNLHMDGRRVRMVIAELIEAGELIGSSVSGDHLGYFMIETEPELEATRAVLRSRARKIFSRDAALRKSWERTHGNPLQPLLIQEADW